MKNAAHTKYRLKFLNIYREPVLNFFKDRIKTQQAK